MGDAPLTLQAALHLLVWQCIVSVWSFCLAVRSRVSDLRQVPWANSSAAASDLAARGAITTGILTRAAGTGWVAYLDAHHARCLHGKDITTRHFCGLPEPLVQTWRHAMTCPQCTWPRSKTARSRGSAARQAHRDAANPLQRQQAAPLQM